MKRVVFLGVLTFLQSLARGVVAEKVSCVFNESCILPCIFEADLREDLVIQWMKVSTGKTTVHSFYRNQDHFEYQDPRFKGRTALFRDQIFRGNASLKLERVEIPDEGTYRCYASIEGGSSHEAFIKLKVDAPVLKVDIQQAENKTTCSSEGIYPEPQLIWSIDPPPNETLHIKTLVHQTEQKLYNIQSSLNVKVTDVNYICTVSTRRNKRAATLVKLTSLSGSSTETTMSCTSSKSPRTGLIWRFNHSQIIVSDESVMEEWRQQVKSVSKSGDLTLKDLSTDHDGIYTCELRNAEGTYVTNTFLRIEQSQVSALTSGGIACIVVVAVSAVFVAVLVVLYRKGKNKTKEQFWVKCLAQGHNDMPTAEGIQFVATPTHHTPPQIQAENRANGNNDIPEEEIPLQSKTGNESNGGHPENKQPLQGGEHQVNK